MIIIFDTFLRLRIPMNLAQWYITIFLQTLISLISLMIIIFNLFSRSRISTYLIQYFVTISANETSVYPTKNNYL